MTRVQETDDDENWVKTAMSNDSAVAELLTLFRQERGNKSSLSLPSPPLEWTVKQPRSKATARTSPSTPLSWSGSQESNQLLKMKLKIINDDGARSKGTDPAGINISKRSRKKRTMAELKAEETLLVMEKGHLMRQLETFRFTLENQRATNESLKRYKIDLQSQTQLERGLLGPFVDSIPNQVQLQNTISQHSSSSISREDFRYEKCDTYKRLISTAENSSEQNIMPDLNLPFGEHSNIELL